MISKKSFDIKSLIILIFFILIIIFIVSVCAQRYENKNTPDFQKNNGDLAAGIAVQQDASLNKIKILHIMSYHSPWEWTDTLFEGFKYALKDLDVEYKTFEMDTKRNSSVKAMQEKGLEARGLIESWKPDLVYTTDDDAQEYVGRYYVNKGIPFVFSAVNGSPEKYGYAGSRNITGVLEVEHFIESVKLLKEVVPEAKKIAVVYDDAAMWEPVIKRMRENAEKLPEVEFTDWDRILTFDQYKKKIAEYETKVDAIALIGIFNFKDKNGKNVLYQDVLEWTSDNSRLPDFSFWKDRASFGTLCVVSVSGYEQGLAAGKIARSILIDGKSASDLPMEATTKGEAVVSLARAKKLGIQIPSKILLSTKVENEFMWER